MTNVKSGSKLTQPLTGETLLAKVEKLATLSREEKAKHCGYSIVKKSGAEYIDVVQFIVEVLRAKGIDLTRTESSSNALLDGQSMTYRTTVLPSGGLEIDASYINLMDLFPGDFVEVASDDACIYLYPKS